MTDRLSARRWTDSASEAEGATLVATEESLAPEAPKSYTPNGATLDASLRSVSRRRSGERAGILIADDHPIFRDGLRKLIESQEGMWVAGESSVSGEVVRLARGLKPDVILLDLGLPRRSGFQVLADLANLPSPARTLVLADAMDQSAILETLYLGAYGIVLKGSPREVLVKSICSVIQGQYWLDNASVPVVIEALRKVPPTQNGSVAKDFGLTPQELKIVGTVANGSSNKEVSQVFCISERTVKHHLTNVFQKLGLSSRVELAVFALEHGLAHKR